MKPTRFITAALIISAALGPKHFVLAGESSPGTRSLSSTNARDENADLRKRVQGLEKELDDLKRLVRKQAEAFKAAENGNRRLSEYQLRQVRKDVFRDADKRTISGFPVWSNLDIQLYGYIKLDAAYDTSRTNTGNFARWVEHESGRDNDSQFNMTARETRLGFRVNGPDVGPARTSGRVEIDFFGGGGENKPTPMMRHAYMKIDWPESRFSIIAGQTSDVISPLVPNTLNYSVAWWAGDIGYRRPQIRLTKQVKLGENVDVKIEGAVARTIGRNSGFDPGDTGEDMGFPGVQGRASVTFPSYGPKPATVGVSGHWAREEYDTDALDHHKILNSWSANIDVTQPINKRLTVKAEAFTGANLDAYLGGIGQGVDAATIGQIGSWGGWIAAALGPWDKWRFNVGGSIECVDASDVTSPTARTRNSSVFGNVIYDINPNASVGLELSRWETRYKDRSTGDSLRAQTSFIYRW